MLSSLVLVLVFLAGPSHGEEQRLLCWQGVPLLLVGKDGARSTTTVWEFFGSSDPNGKLLATALQDALDKLSDDQLPVFAAAVSLPGILVGPGGVETVPRIKWELHIADSELAAIEIQQLEALVAAEAYAFLHCPPLSEKEQIRAREQLTTIAGELRRCAWDAGFTQSDIDAEMQTLDMMVEYGTDGRRYGASLQPASADELNAALAQIQEAMRQSPATNGLKQGSRIARIWFDVTVKHGFHRHPSFWKKGADAEYEAIVAKRLETESRLQQALKKREKQSTRPNTTDSRPSANGMTLSPRRLGMSLLTTRPASRPSSQPASRPSG